MNTEFLIAIIVAVFGSTGFWSWLSNRQRNKSNESKLLVGIAYSKIIDICERHIANGYITTRELHELEHYLYQPYHNMGYNGTVETLMEQVRELPIRTEKG